MNGLQKNLFAGKGPVSLRLSDDHTTLIVSGSLNFNDAVALRNAGKHFLAQETPSEVFIDLNEIKRCDNSGLVLLVAWMRDARQQKKTVIYRKVPEFLLRMAEVFELQDILFLRSKSSTSG